MTSPAALSILWRHMLLAKLRYIEAELELAKQSIEDIELRGNMVKDLGDLFQQTAKELADGFNHSRIGTRWTHPKSGAVEGAEGFDWRALQRLRAAERQEIRKRGIPFERGQHKGGGSSADSAIDSGSETGC